MVIGIPNPNAVAPISKMCITNTENNKKIFVLYNPESYVQERTTKFSESAGVSSNAPSTQFVHGSTETLSMELFFDTYSAGAEIGGTAIEKAKMAGTSLLSSSFKVDVREYTLKIYELMIIDKGAHVPPLLKIEWSSLQFTGHLVSCSQRFVKFNEDGMPVRAVLNVKFMEHKEPTKIAEITPTESPDTAKYRTVAQGDSLWQFSGKEYGECSSWRVIARANGIVNPRLLDSGGMLKLPAL